MELSYVDMYLIHTPFGVPITDGDFKRDSDGDIILDSDTDHIATWKVSIRESLFLEEILYKNSKIIEQLNFFLENGRNGFEGPNKEHWSFKFQQVPTSKIITQFNYKAG